MCAIIFDVIAPIACIYAIGAIIRGIAPATKGRGPVLACQPGSRVPGLIRSVGYRYSHAGYLYPQYPHWGNLDRRLTVYRYIFRFALLTSEKYMSRFYPGYARCRRAIRARNRGPRGLGFTLMCVLPLLWRFARLRTYRSHALRAC